MERSRVLFLVFSVVLLCSCASGTVKKTIPLTPYAWTEHDRIDDELSIIGVMVSASDGKWKFSSVVVLPFNRTYSACLTLEERPMNQCSLSSYVMPGEMMPDEMQWMNREWYLTSQIILSEQLPIERWRLTRVGDEWVFHCNFDLQNVNGFDVDQFKILV